METIKLILILSTIIMLVVWLTKTIIAKLTDLYEIKYRGAVSLDKEDLYPDLTIISQSLAEIQKLIESDPKAEVETMAQVKIAILKQLEAEILSKHVDKARLLAEIYCTLKNEI